MLVKAVEAEVTAYIEAHQHEVDENGRRLVVRNASASSRGPRSRRRGVDDRRTDDRGPAAALPAGKSSRSIPVPKGISTAISVKPNLAGTRR